MIEKALEDVQQDQTIQVTLEKKMAAKERNEVYVDESFRKLFETLP